MIDVLMPQLGESVAEGTVTKWLVKAGDFVKREQPLLEVATDKADTEVPAPAAGLVVEIAASEGAVIAKQGLLCRIDETAAQAPAAPKVTVAQKEGGAEERPLTTPSTRKLALEAGVDLRDVQPTGDRGRVTRDDILRATAPAPAPSEPAPLSRREPPPPSRRDAAPLSRREAPPPPPSRSGAAVPNRSAAPEAARAETPAAAELSQMIQAGGGFVPPIPGVGYGTYKVPPYTPRPGDEVVPFTRRRRITADHMVYSKAASPHVVTVAEIDLMAISKVRDAHKDQFKKEGIPLTFLTFICAATVKALRQYPQINARVLESSFVVLRDINLGVAVDTPGGLVVPSIKHAEQLSLRGLASTIDDLATRARAGKITADDLAGTTFSISNPGLKGNLFGVAIISQPNVGILRMGEIKKRVVVVSNGGSDVIAIHPMMYAALSYDHRIIDGVLANEFLWYFADVLNRADLEI